MSLTVMQKAMGQTEQRTLHPFFGKTYNDYSRKVSDTSTSQPGLQNDSTAPSEDPPDQQPSIDYSIPLGDKVQTSNSEGGKHKEINIMVSNDVPKEKSNPHIDTHNSDQNIHRRKRRKTANPELPNSQTTCMPDGKVKDSGIELAPLVEQLKFSAEDEQDESIVNPDPPVTPAETQIIGSIRYSEAKTVRGSGEEPQQRRKTMRLNSNGTLLSSPPGVGGDGSGSNGNPPRKRRRTSSRKKMAQQPIPTTRLVKIGYGLGDTSRQVLGGSIDDIINGRTSYSLLKRRETRKTRPQAQSKPTHPFFLSKPAKIPATTSLSPQASYPSSSTNLASVLPSDKLKFPAVRSSLQSLPAASEVATTFPVFSNRARHFHGSEPLDPLWPPRDMVHVRDLTNHIHHGNSSTPLEKKKAKGSVISIPELENIFSIKSDSLHKSALDESNISSSRKALRRPKKALLTGKQLKQLVLERLSCVSIPAGATFPQEADIPALFGSLHPALAKLVSSLETAKSPFDRGGFDEIPWICKHSPKSAVETLQVGSEVSVLRDWLQGLVVSAVSTGMSGSPDPRQSKQKSDNNTSRKKKRKKPKDLEGFIISSSDEEPVMDEVDTLNDDDELAGGLTVPGKRSVVRSSGLGTDTKHPYQKRPISRTILLSGPSGCGKTAAIYAVANELGFDVFEINAGSRRSAKDVIERVGDMTQNHLVHLLNQVDADTTTELPPGLEEMTEDTNKQSTMANYFKKDRLLKNAGELKQNPHHKGHSESLSKEQRNKKQSLILLEEVDVLFDEDKQFWSAVLALISQSKRPIIMTCNDENVLPLSNINFHAILRLRQPPCDLAIDYLLALSANEGHLLDRNSISELYTVCNWDLRATIMQLDFWCQMAVGSRKSGLDWISPQEFIYSDTVQSVGSLPRTVSCNTYVTGMGWYSPDMAVRKSHEFDKKLQLMTEGIDQWSIGLTNWIESRPEQLTPEESNGIDALAEASYAADMKSVLDLICPGEYDDLSKHPLDPSLPSIPVKQRSDYVEGYQLLNSDLRPNYTSLSTNIGATLSILLEESRRGEFSIGEESDIINHALEKSSPRAMPLRRSTFHNAFQPIIESPDYAIPAAHHRLLAFENSTTVLAEDVAPFIRAIVAFDLRLERSRTSLSGLISQGEPPNKRMRTTRASRAALEGGDKANMRRERWFSGRLNAAQIMATGGDDWGGISYQQELQGKDVHVETVSGGHMQFPSNSSSEGGI